MRLLVSTQPYFDGWLLGVGTVYLGSSHVPSSPHIRLLGLPHLCTYRVAHWSAGLGSGLNELPPIEG